MMNLTHKVAPSWQNFLHEECQKPYFIELEKFLDEAHKDANVYPPQSEIFKALELTDLENTKIVILGQDPYHGAGQAHGLCFSVNDGVVLPPSLRNIFKEQATDLGIVQPTNGNLSVWATQGVLLLNTTLTVRENQAASHQNRGWEIFTDAVIKRVNEHTENNVFMLWGSHARSKSELISQDKHLVLAAVHPSPLSAYRGFFGCKHFSQANQYLKSYNKQPIQWQL